MKQVLLATLEYPPHVGGIAQYLANVVGCAPKGCLTVLAPFAGDTHALDVCCDAPIYRQSLLWKFMKPGWLPALAAVDRFCRKEKPAATVVSHVLPMGRVARYAKRRYGIPYVVILHGLDVGLAMSSPHKRAAAKAILREADRVVVNSSFTGRLAAALDVPAEKIILAHPTPNALKMPTSSEVEAFRVRFGLQGAFVALSVGRLVARKGFDTAILALAKLRERGQDAKLVIVGDGPERKHLEALAKNCGLAGRVIFTGGLNDSELAAAYETSQVFVMTPRAIGPDVEGFGTVYLEAGLFGKPAIGSRSGGVPEAVLHGKTGLLVEPNNADDLADALGILIGFPAYGRALGQNGKERAERDFVPAVQNRALFEYLETL